MLAGHVPQELSSTPSSPAVPHLCRLAPPQQQTVDERRSNGRHRVGYELSWLQLSDPSRRLASDAVRRNLGDHARSALHYEYISDNRERDGRGLVCGGHAVRAHASVAGLTPDKSRLQYVRGQVDAQHVTPLSGSGALVVDFAAGPPQASILAAAPISALQRALKAGAACVLAH